jgi:hypothetical protein
MPLFDPLSRNACRLCFIVNNEERASKIVYDKKENMSMKMQYARGYGVFDHWNGFNSAFIPSWEPFLPCETRFGIEGGTFNAAQELPAQTPATGNEVVGVHGSISQNAVATAAIRPDRTSIEKVIGRKTR